MTYADLLVEMRKWEPEQLDKDVTVYLMENDEYIAASNEVRFAGHTDNLPKDQPFFVV